MAESMKDYETELEASFKKIEEGDILTGTVISVDEKEVVVDLKYYAEGIIPAEDYGGLKDTVQPYNMFENTGNGFTFDRYESGLLYDAINRAKTLYFENRKSWDDMVIRDMNKDVSWEKSAKQYKDMYVGLTPRD